MGKKENLLKAKAAKAAKSAQLKVEKAEKLKIKKAEILKAKSEKFLQSKLKKAEIAKGKAGLKGDIRIQAILENKKRLIKKYNEISFGEDQILLITPLKNGMIKKMISEKKKKIREDLKIRKIQLSVEMKKKKK